MHLMKTLEKPINNFQKNIIQIKKVKIQNMLEYKGPLKFFQIE